MDKFETVILPVHVEGAVFGGLAGDSFPATLTFNPEWLINPRNTVYNYNLAALSALLATDAYFRPKDLSKGTQNRVLIDNIPPEEYSFSTIYSKLGFTEYERYESFKNPDYDCDFNDSVTLNVAHGVFGEKYDLFLVVIRGCYSAGEWMSAFDVGADTPEYEAVSGVHPDWENRTNSKGIDVSANRAYRFVSKYIESKSDASRQKCILVCGHSRGGSISNIIGAKLEDRNDSICRTYTFNATTVSTDRSVKFRYRTIFNIFDHGDILTRLISLKKDKMYHYGRKVIEDIASSDSLRSKIADLKQRDDYNTVSAYMIKNYKALFGICFESKAALYYERKNIEVFITEEEAVQRYRTLTECVSAEKGLALSDYIKISECRKIGEEWQICVTYRYADVLQAIGRIFSYGAPSCLQVKTLFKDNTYICRLSDFILDNDAGIDGGHLICNSYVVAKYNLNEL